MRISPSSSLKDALIERWFDVDEDNHETLTDEQILKRIEDLVGEGWHHAGMEMDRSKVLQRTVRATNDNALAWHAGEDGKARALNMIAVWTSEALAGRLHPSVESITE